MFQFCIDNADSYKDLVIPVVQYTTDLMLNKFLLVQTTQDKQALRLQ